MKREREYDRQKKNRAKPFTLTRLIEENTVSVKEQALFVSKTRNAEERNKKTKC